jgi:phosphopantetheinyl transferase (holo-ACP synthase)
VDVASVARIAAAVRRWDGAFLARAFHLREVAEYRRRAERHGGGVGSLGGANGGSRGSSTAAVDRQPSPADTWLAGRWAAKEAIHKALRTRRLLFPEIEIVSGGTIVGHRAGTSAGDRAGASAGDRAGATVGDPAGASSGSFGDTAPVDQSSSGAETARSLQRMCDPWLKPMHPSAVAPP